MGQSFYLKSFVSFLLFALVCSAAPAEPGSEGEKPLEIEISHYEDLDSRLNPIEAREMYHQGLFMRHRADTFNFGFSRATHWFYFKVTNPNGHSLSRYLEIPFPAIDRVDFYRLDQDILVPESRGNSAPVDSLPWQHVSPLYLMEFKAGQTKNWLVQVVDEGAVPLEFRWVSEDQLHRKRNQSAIRHGVFYGLLLVVGFLSFVSWTLLKERYFLIFGLLVGFELLMVSHNDGYLRLVLLQDFGSWSLNRLFVASVAGTLGCVLWFTWAFLDLKKINRPLYRLMQGLIATLGFTVVWSLVGDFNSASEALSLQALVVFLAMATATLVGLKRRITAAVYFFLAFFFMELAGVALALQYLGALTNFDLVDSMVHFGIAAEVLLLVFALGERLLRLNRENQQAQADLLARQREAAEANEQRAQELARMDRLKDEFLANTTHELNTPLFGMLGLLESLQETATERLKPQEKNQLDMIEAMGRRLTHLIRDILDFSALKNDRLSLHLKPVELCTLLEFVTSLMAPLARSKQLDLSLVLPPERTWVRADETRLQQILFNLIGNALKFTHQGQVKVSVELEREQAWVKVKDTGVGLPKGMWAQLFEPFTQGHPETLGEMGGSGLGLSITLKLIDLQGGRLEMDSQPGEGACFAFCLPRSEAPANGVLAEQTDPEKHHPSPEEPPPTDGPMVLVVDDEPGNLSVLNDLLTRRGYQVTLQPGGPEALDWLEENQPDLVLLDLMMPFTNGLEICREIRRWHRPEELPVLLLTARNAPEALQEAFAAGVNDYITKPIIGRELINRLEMHLKVKENSSLQGRVRILDQAHQDLERHREHLREVLEQSAEPILVFTADLKPNFANLKARQLLGLNEPKAATLDQVLENTEELRQVIAAGAPEAQITELKQTKPRNKPAQVALARLSNGDWMLSFTEIKAVQPPQELDFRQLLVKVMQLSLEQWEQASGLNKFDLAEKSGIWRIYQDEGRLRTRILDKYCSLKTLPKKPRYMDVLRTAHFVLAEYPEKGALHDELKQSLEALQVLV